MAGGFEGMDAGQVRDLASQMDRSAEQIDQLSNQLTNKLKGTNWVGPDRLHFEGEWTGPHRSQLNQVVNALRDAANKARRNAQEQDDASGRA